ncbi:hypothetical protein JXB31_00880 [Candidatus Woesearchaeota archaeon]|nr:hypothetical protein [Candidatus Woesearchaeota archaeon]
MEFVDFFERLEDFGMTDALLPFLLIFVIVFATLQKTNLLGSGKKNFNIIISAIIGLLVVIPHVTNSYPQNRDVVEIINNSLPQLSMLMVAIIMALLLIGLMGGEASWIGGSLSGWIAIIAFLLVVYIFGGSMGIWENSMFSRWFGRDTSSIIVIILIFAIVVWYITRDADSEKASKGFNLIKEFGDMFKK